MTVKFELTAQKRNHVGKGASRRLRRQNQVPAILYGAHKEAIPITLSQREINKALENEAFYSNVLTIKLDGTSEKAVLKDMQRHPFKPLILHIDLQRVSEKEKITLHIPLRFVNEEIAPGVKQGGGVITHLINQIEVSCLPADLPEFIEVDVSQLELNQSIHLSAIPLPKGVELPALAHGPDHDVAVVTIQPSKISPEMVETPTETEETSGESST